MTTLSSNHFKTTAVEERGEDCGAERVYHIPSNPLASGKVDLYNVSLETALQEEGISTLRKLGGSQLTKMQEPITAVLQKAIYPNFNWVTKYQPAPGTPELRHKVVSILLQQLKSLRKKSLTLEDQELPTRWPLRK